MLSRLLRHCFSGLIVMCSLGVASGASAATSSAGTLSFSSSSYAGKENGGAITVTVTRTGGANGAASINYLTSGNTALLYVDYEHTAGTLVWANGDTSAKTITVPLINGDTYSGTKDFFLTLSGATGAAAGSPSVATLVITGDGAPGAANGALEFATPNYQVAQNSASFSLSVVRTGAGVRRRRRYRALIRPSHHHHGMSRWSWARRLKRVFGVEIERCTRCGGQLKIIASIEEPQLIAKILSHLERAAPEQSQSELPLGARGPPAQPSLL